MEKLCRFSCWKIIKKSEGENMYFRLTQVDIQDGKMEDTLAYAASVMIF